MKIWKKHDSIQFGKYFYFPGFSICWETGSISIYAGPFFLLWLWRDL